MVKNRRIETKNTRLDLEEETIERIIGKYRKSS